MLANRLRLLLRRSGEQTADCRFGIHKPPVQESLELRTVLVQRGLNFGNVVGRDQNSSDMQTFAGPLVYWHV